MNDTAAPPASRLCPRDYLLLTALCVVLFGFAGLYERVLTTHETVHCINVREMLASQDWIIPTYGGRVWLERPPLPHWITAALAAPFGAGDQVWTYRLGSHLCGLICVLLTARMGSVLLGRSMGLLSGAILATMFEFYTYSTGAEADIGLCLIVTCALACLVQAEFGSMSGVNHLVSLVGKRTWAITGFFFFLGLTNAAKGLFFGSFFVLLPFGGYLLTNFTWLRFRRYFWLWGMLLTLATASAWALAAWLRFPDIVDLWHSDYVGRLNQGAFQEPVWYYFANLPLIVFPWLLPAIIGLGLAMVGAFQRDSGEVSHDPSMQEEEAGMSARKARLLACWALLPLAFFSIPDGKHHHYLLHGLTPWAILGAIGTREIWSAVQHAGGWIRSRYILPIALTVPSEVALFLARKKVPGSDVLLPWMATMIPVLIFSLWALFRHANARVAAYGSFALLVVLYCGVWVYRTAFLNRYEHDLALIERARQTVPDGKTIYVAADVHPLTGSWWLFYLGNRSAYLHNLTYLRDEDIPDTTIYIVGRLYHSKELQKYGQAEVIDQSAHSRYQYSEEDRQVLFRFTYRDDLERVAARSVHISPCQAARRAPGPFLD